MMHCATFVPDPNSLSNADILLAALTLIKEGRTNNGSNASKKASAEGHCSFLASSIKHKCSFSNAMCISYDFLKDEVLKLCYENTAICIEVYVTMKLEENGITSESELNLLECWNFSIVQEKNDPSCLSFNILEFVNAVRSQLHFSQITAWLEMQCKCQTKITGKNFHYRVALPNNAAPWKSSDISIEHTFPCVNLGSNKALKLYYRSLKIAHFPIIRCISCNKIQNTAEKEVKNNSQKYVAKIHHDHKCSRHKRVDIIKKDIINDSDIMKCNLTEKEIIRDKDVIEIMANRAKIKNCAANPENILGTILGTKIVSDKKERTKKKMRPFDKSIATTSGLIDIQSSECDKNCDTKECDSSVKCIYDEANSLQKKVHYANLFRKKISFEQECEKYVNIKNKGLPSPGSSIPTTSEQENFRKNLGNAASMVFHSRTGLPLTSSPAPVRRQSSRFDFDSSLNSVSAIRSALFSTTFPTDDESESDDINQTSPSSPLDTYLYHRATAPRYMGKYHCSSLLGSFEESVLNGRLKPASTVHGFSAELGASGSFVPKHLHVPVTVFFYTFGENGKITSPYLSHINLGRKGYNVPKSGTVQVTLFNPAGTVVKMFVVMYDFSDMPPNSQTFIRQRTMYVPTNCSDANIEWDPKWLRYLIHLRFITSKSGKLYLHSDIRIIIFHKSDQDTANAHAIDTSYELRSFTHIPVNPRYSSRTSYK